MSQPYRHTAMYFMYVYGCGCRGRGASLGIQEAGAGAGAYDLVDTTGHLIPRRASFPGMSTIYAEPGCASAISLTMRAGCSRSYCDDDRAATIVAKGPRPRIGGSEPTCRSPLRMCVVQVGVTMRTIAHSIPQ